MCAWSSCAMAHIIVTWFIVLIFMTLFLINPNSLDNKGSWRILKDFYCSVTMLRELGLILQKIITPEPKKKKHNLFMIVKKMKYPKFLSWTCCCPDIYYFNSQMYMYNVQSCYFITRIEFAITTYLSVNLFRERERERLKVHVYCVCFSEHFDQYPCRQDTVVTALFKYVHVWYVPWTHAILASFCMLTRQPPHPLPHPSSNATCILASRYMFTVFSNHHSFSNLPFFL